MDGDVLLPPSLGVPQDDNNRNPSKRDDFFLEAVASEFSDEQQQQAGPRYLGNEEWKSNAQQQQQSSSQQHMDEALKILKTYNQQRLSGPKGMCSSSLQTPPDRSLFGVAGYEHHFSGLGLSSSNNSDNPMSGLSMYSINKSVPSKNQCNNNRDSPAGSNSLGAYINNQTPELLYHAAGGAGPASLLSGGGASSTASPHPMEVFRLKSELNSLQMSLSSLRDFISTRRIKPPNNQPPNAQTSQPFPTSAFGTWSQKMESKMSNEKEMELNELQDTYWRGSESGLGTAVAATEETESIAGSGVMSDKFQQQLVSLLQNFGKRLSQLESRNPSKETHSDQNRKRVDTEDSERVPTGETCVSGGRLGISSPETAATEKESHKISLLESQQWQGNLVLSEATAFKNPRRANNNNGVGSQTGWTAVEAGVPSRAESPGPKTQKGKTKTLLWKKSQASSLSQLSNELAIAKCRAWRLEACLKIVAEKLRERKVDGNWNSSSGGIIDGSFVNCLSAAECTEYEETIRCLKSALAKKTDELARLSAENTLIRGLLLTNPISSCGGLPEGTEELLKTMQQLVLRAQTEIRKQERAISVLTKEIEIKDEGVSVLDNNSMISWLTNLLVTDSCGSPTTTDRMMYHSQIKQQPLPAQPPGRAPHHHHHHRRVPSDIPKSSTDSPMTSSRNLDSNRIVMTSRTSPPEEDDDGDEDDYDEEEIPRRHKEPPPHVKASVSGSRRPKTTAGQTTVVSSTQFLVTSPTNSIEGGGGSGLNSSSELVSFSIVPIPAMTKYVPVSGDPVDQAVAEFTNSRVNKILLTRVRKGFYVFGRLPIKIRLSFKSGAPMALFNGKRYSLPRFVKLHEAEEFRVLDSQHIKGPSESSVSTANQPLRQDNMHATDQPSALLGEVSRYSYSQGTTMRVSKKHVASERTETPTLNRKLKKSSPMTKFSQPGSSDVPREILVRQPVLKPWSLDPSSQQHDNINLPLKHSNYEMFVQQNRDHTRPYLVGGGPTSASTVVPPSPFQTEPAGSSSPPFSGKMAHVMSVPSRSLNMSYSPPLDRRENPDIQAHPHYNYPPRNPYPDSSQPVGKQQLVSNRPSDILVGSGFTNVRNAQPGLVAARHSVTTPDIADSGHQFNSPSVRNSIPLRVAQERVDYARAYDSVKRPPNSFGNPRHFLNILKTVPSDTSGIVPANQEFAWN